MRTFAAILVASAIGLAVCAAWLGYQYGHSKGMDEGREYAQRVA